MRNLMQDRVTIVHRDGERRECIRASVQRGRVFTHDTTIPISVGDRIERKLPSGQQEVLLVTDVHLWSGNARIRDYYEIAYIRDGSDV